MRSFQRAVAALVLAAVLPGALAAQTVTPTVPGNPTQIPVDNTAFGGSSAEFLEFGSSARGMALGNGGFAAIVDDVNSLQYNPAGLTELDGAQATGTIMPYIAETDYFWSGVAVPLGNGDNAFGAFIARFGFNGSPVFTEADPNGLSGETFGVDEVVAGMSFAHAFIDRFSAGLTVKFINDDLATGSLGGATARTIAIDFGTNFHDEFFGRPIRLAFVVQNLGGDLTSSGDALRFRARNTNESVPDQRLDAPPVEVKASNFPLPRLFRIAMGYDLVHNGDVSRLSLTGEFVESNNQASTVGFGSEFAWQSPDTPIGASLRGSWQLQPDERSLGAPSASDTNLDGFNFGGGITYRIAGRYKASFDYAYRHLGALGNVDVFSFTFGGLTASF